MAIGLFGRRMTRPSPVIVENGKPPEQYDPLGQGLQRPRGLFGRLGNALRNVDWEAVGAAMRDDPSILQNLQSQRNERRLLDFRVRGAKQDEADTQSQRDRQAQIDAMAQEYIASLPAAQQGPARMRYMVDPEGFAEQIAGGGQEWQSGQGYSHTFRVNPDGTVTRGDALPLRPRAPIQGYGYPSEDGAIYVDELPEDLR